jgi:hypothetical protein
MSFFCLYIFNLPKFDNLQPFKIKNFSFNGDSINDKFLEFSIIKTKKGLELSK